MTRSTSKGTVLTNAAGKTLYWFAIDTSTTSKCTGTCVTYWPPVIGKPTAAAGTSLPHGFSTITRSGGQTQATYDGHPLYTYAGDSAAGMVSGNGLNLSGGLWWAMTPAGSKLGSSTTSSGTTSGGAGGGGY
jgi:predicted lipoprotein with Yx(FWY)xxD motif